MNLVFVNGYTIRQFLDTNFNILHIRRKNPLIYDSKWFIPANEAWCDSRFHEEAGFLFKVETSHLRGRAAIARRFAKRGSHTDYIMRRITHGDMTIAFVNGTLIRAHIDPQFVMGGHDLVYNYIPKGEVWLDAKLDSRDITHVLIHELAERTVMKRGKTYDIAHEWATVTERESRRQAGASYPGDEKYPFKNFNDLLKKIYAQSSKR